MKRLLPAVLVATFGLFALGAHAQGYVEAQVHFPVPPLPRIHLHVPPPPVVVDTYNENCAPAEPYYNGYENPQVIVTRPEVIYEGRGYNHRYYERFHDNYRGYRDHGYYRENNREHGYHDRGRERRHW